MCHSVVSFMLNNLCVILLSHSMLNNLCVILLSHSMLNNLCVILLSHSMLNNLCVILWSHSMLNNLCVILWSHSMLNNLCVILWSHSFGTTSLHEWMVNLFFLDICQWKNFVLKYFAIFCTLIYSESLDMAEALE